MGNSDSDTQDLFPALPSARVSTHPPTRSLSANHPPTIVLPFTTHPCVCLNYLASHLSIHLSIYLSIIHPSSLPLPSLLPLPSIHAPCIHLPSIHYFSIYPFFVSAPILFSLLCAYIIHPSSILCHSSSLYSSSILSSFTFHPSILSRY